MFPARPSRQVTLVFGVLACLSSFGMAQAQAQAQSPGDMGSGAGAVVQQLPANDGMTLNAALARLGRNPRDVDALIDAGQAALAIGDVDAAIGFYSRAEQVTPGNARVKVGLARALVRSGNPFDAIPLFQEADRAGAMDAASALDRGLAYDLVSDNATAQRYYRQALAGGQGDEATRRLAVSLAIAGDKRGSGTTLSPLLMRQDKAAWRARAFSLAIMGQTEEAITVVNGTLPASLAAGIAPYLRYMPRLTPSQQAAAANFGQFPRASEIGRDDPRVAAFAPVATGRRPSVASADTALIPKGEPLGRNSRNRNNRDNGDRNPGSRTRPPEVAVAALRPPVPSSPSVRPAAVAPTTAAMPVPAPAPTARVVVPSPAPVSPPPVARPAAIAVAPTPAPSPPVPLRIPATAPTPAPAPALAQAPPPALPAPQIARAPAILAQPAAQPASPPPVAAAPPPPPLPVTPVAGPAAPAAPIPPTPRRQSLAEAFSDLGRPTADVSPASGAVDIRRIRPTRQPAAGPATTPAPATPSHPSRIWVQLATGRDKTALSYDFRRMARDADAAFKGKRPFTSTWGQSNRLLTGPFETEAAANSFLGQLRRANVTGGFLWTSPAGQVVDALGGR